MGLKVFLESPFTFPVSKQGSVETAGIFIPCCYFSTPLEQPQSTGLEFKKMMHFWFLLVLTALVSQGCFVLWTSGFRFYLWRLPLTGCLLRSSFLSCWRAEMGCWTVYFLFLTSPLLFSLAGIKRAVTSWLLKGLFKEGCSVLPLVETYSHPRTCYYCFKAVILKLSRSTGYPAVINSEVRIMTKIQITNHMVKKKKKWFK